MLVSYADLNEVYERKIYQASNWTFVGTTGHEAGIMLNGKLTHRKTINSKYGTSDIEWLRKRIDLNPMRHEKKPKFNMHSRSITKRQNVPDHSQNLTQKVVP